MVAMALIVAGVLSCVTASVTPTGAKRFAPLPEGSHVLVFAREAEITRPYITVGLINYRHGGGSLVTPTIEDAMDVLKAKAREVGANAILIDQALPTTIGLRSGLSITARAIRITD